MLAVAAIDHVFFAAAADGSNHAFAKENTSRIDRLVRARADGPGNLLMLVGADTGRDGIHGENTHHILEAVFKSLAVSLHHASRIVREDIPSTKGTL